MKTFVDIVEQDTRTTNNNYFELLIAKRKNILRHKYHVLFLSKEFKERVVPLQNVKLEKEQGRKIASAFATAMAMTARVVLFIATKYRANSKVCQLHFQSAAKFYFTKIYF